MTNFTALTPETQQNGSLNGGWLQRKCDCGNRPLGVDTECEECQQKKAFGLQAKLVVGASNDPLEKEADRAAAQVMNQTTTSFTTPASPRLSRRANGAGESQSVPASVHQTLQTPGEPLPDHTRNFFEPRFGHDFSRVRIHLDTEATRSANEVSANAYTVGHHVVFNDEKYSPGTHAGKSLLAHELAHVVQQSDISESLLQREDGNNSGQRRVFSLTFDDGPHAASLGSGNNRTEKVLDTLRSKNAHAGFFIQTHALGGEGWPHRGNTSVGRQLIRRMRSEGHAIGIHTGGTQDHESHTSAQAAGRLQSELETARNFIQETTTVEAAEGVEAQQGLTTDLVRPPFGRSNEAVRQTYSSMGLTNLLWDIDGDAGGERSLSQLKTQVTTGIREVAARNWRGTTTSAPKIVVLYHDIRRGTSNHIGEVMDHIVSVTRDVDGSEAVFERP